MMLRTHLAGVRLSTDNPPPYRDYEEAIAALMSLTSLACSGRELDRYLWLAGRHQAWQRAPRHRSTARSGCCSNRRRVAQSRGELTGSCHCA